MNIQEEPGTPAQKRDIPTPPCGGSWKFDEDLWDWIDNNPQPAAAEQQL